MMNLIITQIISEFIVANLNIALLLSTMGLQPCVPEGCPLQTSPCQPAAPALTAHKNATATYCNNT